MGRVFNNADAVLSADFENSRLTFLREHLRRLPPVVDNEQCLHLRVLPHGVQENLRGEKTGSILDVQEKGIRSHVADHFGGGGEGHGGNKDPLSRLHP